METAGFLAALTAEDRALLLRAARRARYVDGAPIVAQGDVSGEVYMLLEGAAVVVSLSPEGKAVSHRDIGPGDLFGELAAIDGGPRSAFVQARGPVVACVLARGAFLDALARSPALSLAVMRHLTALVRSGTERVFEGVTRPVRVRLALELLRRAVPTDGGAGVIDSVPRHVDLASRIGTHREAVTKQLSAMTREGLIARSDNAIVIASISRLAREVAG